MNPQPYATPPRWWPSRLSPRLVRWWSRARRRELRQQGIVQLDLPDTDPVSQALNAGQGVLIVSNHSFHYDSYVLIEAGLRHGWTAHFMTAWQVFALATLKGRWQLQRHGCFSVNREGTDAQAFRYATRLLMEDPHPLVIFPEGDIFHSNDRVLPFREGAAALALAANKKSPRPIVVIPAAMKCFYLTDPTAELSAMMDRLEEHIRWRPQRDRPLIERIYRFGSGFLSSKEVEYLGHPQSGSMRERLRSLGEAIMTNIQQRHGLSIKGGTTHERIRNLRSQLIKLIDQTRENKPPSVQEQLEQLHQDMEDLFFVTQLSSYHGDYTAEKPTVERMAETIDKFEEDLFALQYPTPRGKRRAVVRFGEPLSLADTSWKTTDLTRTQENRVQALLNEMNGER